MKAQIGPRYVEVFDAYDDYRPDIGPVPVEEIAAYLKSLKILTPSTMYVEPDQMVLLAAAVILKQHEMIREYMDGRVVPIPANEKHACDLYTMAVFFLKDIGKNPETSLFNKAVKTCITIAEEHKENTVHSEFHRFAANAFQNYSDVVQRLKNLLIPSRFE